MRINMPFRYDNSLIPEIETVIKQTRTSMIYNQFRENSKETQQSAEIPTKMSVSDYMVAFSGHTENYCIGLVDMVDSTRISANLHERDWCKYYSIFLNSMSKIIVNFGGQPIKNGGDSLLYYFPESNKSKSSLKNCLECSMAMIEVQSHISKKTQEEHLPPINYRVSADYGKVVLMTANNSSLNDVIGPPVNMCSKINRKAKPNGVVVGGDMYQMVRDLKEYHFESVPGISIGLKYTYPIYVPSRRKHK